MTETLNKLDVHVGVISDGDALDPRLRAELRDTLDQIGVNHARRRMFLHHGCGSAADKVAHRAAVDLRWQIAGHPVLRASGGSYLLPGEIMRGLAMLCPPKPLRERDARIISQSDFIVAVQPADEQVIEMLSRAELAGCRVTYLGRVPHRRPVSTAKPSIPRQAERHPGVPHQQGRPQAAGKPAPEDLCTHAEAFALPRRRDACVHVGVITGGSSIRGAQAAALARELRRIPIPRGGKLILHHGCAPGADIAAHETVRTIKGWEIHGHPATGSTNGHPPAGIRQLHTVHRAKQRDQRDADIIRASVIVIFVEPGPPGAKLLRASAAGSRTIIHVPIPARRKAINAPTPTRKKRKRAAQPDRRTSKMASYATYDAQQARNAELLRKVNPPELLVDAWR
jgi:hypothetical protein